MAQKRYKVKGQMGGMRAAVNREGSRGPQTYVKQGLSNPAGGKKRRAYG